MYPVPQPHGQSHSPTPGPQPAPPPRVVPRGFRTRIWFLIPMGIGIAVFFSPVMAIPFFFRRFPLIGFVPIVVMMLIGPMLIVAALVARFRFRKLYKSGHVALAHVVHIRLPTTSNVATKVVYYQFNVAGTVVDGRVQTENPPPVGGPLWVLYAPDNPSRNHTWSEFA